MSRNRVLAFGLALSVALIAQPAWSADTVRVAPQSATQLQLSYAGVVRQTTPAVVNIYSKRKVRNPFAGDPFFQRFFGRGMGGDRVQSALGSGVIVRSDGVIVTSNHVVAGANEIVVALADRREFEARVVLADERTDIAVLRVNVGGKSLPTLAFRDSDDAEVGDIVLAIGNPFGVGQTVTSGIISALARTAGRHLRLSASSSRPTPRSIPATRAARSSTVDGKLIGINTAIYSRSGGNIGIGFAIPANMVKLVVDSALAGSKSIARPWLGVETQTVTADIADSVGLDRPTGVLVTEVASGSPAAEAGLRNGDVVTKVDGFDVNDEQGMNFRVATKGVGNTVNVTYLRGGQSRTAALRLIKAPETTPRASAELEGSSPLQGATVANLSPAVAEELQSDLRTASSSRSCIYAPSRPVSASVRAT